jgi:hypothetical protein
MPIFVLFLATIFGLAALNGTVGTLFKQASGDLFGDGKNKGFLIWAAAIIVIATAMRAIDLPDVGKAFVVLLIVVFLLGSQEKGTDVLSLLLQQVQGISQQQPVADAAKAPAGSAKDLGAGLGTGIRGAK